MALRILATNDLGAALVPLPTSFGESGTVAGIAALLERERATHPTVWLDSGDLVVGNPAYPLTGERPWGEVAKLPIAATAPGNHEFDDGVPALQEAAGRLPSPMLCANVDVGLPASAVVETPDGPLGVIGLTHPQSHLHSRAPEPIGDWPRRVAGLAEELRSDGARWVVALLHDGVDWWPDGPIGLRTDRLERVAAPWAAHVDVILCGHMLAAWTGELAGTPAGHAHAFAASVLVVDLPDPPGRPAVRGIVAAPAIRPAEQSAAVDAVDAAAARVVAESEHTWLSRTGARHYLPELLARALREATDADAGLVVPNVHANQAPVDGAVASLCAGPVTELDLLRLFGEPDDRPVIVELRPGELGAAVGAHDRVADPDARAGDDLWWNWCRMPAAVSTEVDEPATVAVMPNVVRLLGEWLDRDAGGERAAVGAREALVRVLA
jgi:hypothetical protein